MPRFGVRSLFAGTAVVAGLAFLCRGGDYLSAAVVAVSLTLLFVAVRWRRRGWFLPARFGAVLIAALGLWLGGVQTRWGYEWCPDCHWDRDISACCVLNVTVWSQTKEYRPPITRALSDLGVSCNHPNLSLGTLQRYWGGVFCDYPCTCYTLRLSGSDSYTPAVSERLRRLGQADPTLGETVRQRAIVQDDFNYFWDGLMCDVEVSCEIDAGGAHDARAWLGACSTRERREVNWGDMEGIEQCLKQLESLGAKRLLVCQIEQAASDDRTPLLQGSLVAELPDHGPARGAVIGYLRKIRQDYGSGLLDYGQRFAWVRW